MKNAIRPAVVLFVLLTLLTGVAYPLVVTGVARLAFAEQAGGSLVRRGGTVVGSALIGQTFADPKYVWGRPSATSPMPTNASNSGGSNQGPTHPALVEAVKGRIEALRKADPANAAKIPVDLVTASASGLDPEISLAAALYQADRVARARGVPVERVRELIEAGRRDRLLGFLGEPRVNVLQLNLALDASPSR